MIHASSDINNVSSTVSILNNYVDVMDYFVYLGSSVDSSGGNDQDIQRTIEQA